LGFFSEKCIKVTFDQYLGFFSGLQINNNILLERNNNAEMANNISYGENSFLQISKINKYKTNKIETSNERDSNDAQ